MGCVEPGAIGAIEPGCCVVVPFGAVVFPEGDVDGEFGVGDVDGGVVPAGGTPGAGVAPGAAPPAGA